MITSTFCCSDTTVMSVQIGETNSINDLVERPYAISPNPMTEQTIIRMKEGASFEVRVFNTVGQLIQTNQANGELVISGADWQPGMYLIEVRVDDQTFSEKLLKQ